MAAPTSTAGPAAILSGSVNRNLTSKDLKIFKKFYEYLFTHTGTSLNGGWVGQGGDWCVSSWVQVAFSSGLLTSISVIALISPKFAT